jgi:hypothetical protein
MKHQFVFFLIFFASLSTSNEIEARPTTHLIDDGTPYRQARFTTPTLVDENIVTFIQRWYKKGKGEIHFYSTDPLRQRPSFAYLGQYKGVEREQEDDYASLTFLYTTKNNDLRVHLAYPILEPANDARVVKKYAIDRKYLLFAVVLLEKIH